MIEGLGVGDIRGWSCWDLGAHCGLYSIALAMRVGPGGQVAAFEPNPISFARLERHRRMNGVSWLRAYEAAASDRTGGAELLTNGGADSTSTHLRYEDEMENEQSAPIAIRTLRLDELVDSNELRAPQFVKIDVEGHGHRAALGMRATLARWRPAVLVAFHSDREVAGVLEVLQPLGYKAAPVGAPAPAPAVGGDYLFTA